MTNSNTYYLPKNPFPNTITLRGGAGDPTREFWRNTNVQYVAIFSGSQLRLQCLSVQALFFAHNFPAVEWHSSISRGN